MMFIKSQFQTLFAYHWHTNLRLMESAARLSEADYRESPADGARSIHDLFAHVLFTDRGWRLALETGRQPPPPRPEDFPDLASLHHGFDREQVAWQVFLEQLNGDDIQNSVNLITLRGNHSRPPRWRILQHVVLHGMQHHAELAQMLTAKGQSPGNIDFIFFA